MTSSGLMTDHEFTGTWFASCDRFRDPAGAMRMAEFVTALSRFPVGHLVDLGAGHGIFSRLAAPEGKGSKRKS